MSIPNDAPVWRPLQCPVCGRLCGVTDDDVGVHIIHCASCRAWRRIDSAARSLRQVDVSPILRLVFPERSDAVNS